MSDPVVSLRGGRRPGAGRPKGSKNKLTVAREAVAEVFGVGNSEKLMSEIHSRGHNMLLELERIALDPSHPMPTRLMAAKILLPFMLPKQHVHMSVGPSSEDLIERLQEGRARAAQLARSRG